MVSSGKGGGLVTGIASWCTTSSVSLKDCTWEMLNGAADTGEKTELPWNPSGVQSSIGCRLPKGPKGPLWWEKHGWRSPRVFVPPLEI